jgi:hypothetical protein
MFKLCLNSLDIRFKINYTSAKGLSPKAEFGISIPKDKSEGNCLSLWYEEKIISAK